MPLHLKSAEYAMKLAPPVPHGSKIPKQKISVFGRACSMYDHIFPPGYHGTPNMHDAEQLNIVIEGEMYVFINNKAYLIKKGDFLRIPANAVHWAWNKSGAPCRQISCHTPGMQADISNEGIIVPLFGDGEPVVTTGSPKNTKATGYPPEWLPEAESQAK